MREGFIPKREQEPTPFQEWEQLLNREYQQTAETERAYILIKRYFALLAGDSIRPIDPYDLKTKGLMDFNSIRRTLDAHANTLTPFPIVNQFGPSRLIDVPPGEWVDIAQLGAQDVVGSSAFSSCSGLIVEMAERVLFGHVLSSLIEDLEGMKRLFIQKTKADARITLLTPSWNSDSEGAKSWNNRYQRLAQSWQEEGNNLVHAHIPFITQDGTFDRRDTAILRTQQGIFTVGVQYQTLPKRSYSAYQDRRSVAIPDLSTVMQVK